MKNFYNNLKLGILGGGQLGRMLLQKLLTSTSAMLSWILMLTLLVNIFQMNSLRVTSRITKLFTTLEKKWMY
jgi:hypothetical protein